MISAVMWPELHWGEPSGEPSEPSEPSGTISVPPIDFALSTSFHCFRVHSTLSFHGLGMRYWIPWPCLKWWPYSMQVVASLAQLTAATALPYLHVVNLAPGALCAEVWQTLTFVCISATGIWTYFISNPKRVTQWTSLYV